MKTLLPFLAAFAALALTPSAAAPQSKSSGKTHVRHIFVSVIDGKGAPVEGLTASDFKVSRRRPATGSSRTPVRPRTRCGSR